MALVDTKYIRQGKIVKDFETGEVIKEYPSINQAKKWSRITQGANQGGGLVKVQKE